VNKWSKELSREFLKEEVQMNTKHMKKCSTSLVIKEMQIKNTLTPHLTPVRIVIMNNTTANVGKKMGQKGTFRHCWCEFKLVQSPWKIIWRLPKKVKIKLSYNS
jgi:hypothetical protein